LIRHNHGLIILTDYDCGDAFRVQSLADLRNHQAIMQPRLYDCLMVTQVTLWLLEGAGQCGRDNFAFSRVACAEQQSATRQHYSELEIGDPEVR
jgi:hypothetical protein